MDDAIRNKLMHLAKLNYNPLSDRNSVNRLKAEGKKGASVHMMLYIFCLVAFLVSQF